METMCCKIMFRFAIILIISQILVTTGDPVTDDSFDFIIAGGGTAGCALARRLSDSGKYTVLLLERGPIPDPILNIPALSATNHDNYVKIYGTVPQANAGLLNGGVVGYTVGRTLGGSSGVNVMIFNRGSPHDYDNWANITGDSSWRYDNMLQYFRRIEDYQGDFPSSTQHGSGGPITVSQPRYAPVLAEWLAAGLELGYPTADPNGPQLADSFTPLEFAKGFGRRVSSYYGYLRPVMNSRKNLQVITGAVVTRVLTDGDHATGVVYKLGGQGREIHVRSRREVIISSGVIESPAILMRSGIGPRDVLLRHRISPVKYLPVGENLHDHPIVTIQIVINEERAPIFVPSRDLTRENWKIYNTTGDGPFSSYYGTCSQAFFVSSLHHAHVSQNPSIPRDWADIQVYSYAASGVPGIVPNIIEPPMAPWEKYMYSLPFVARPRSKGRVTLKIGDVEGDPNVDFNYFSDPYDMGVMVEAVKRVIQVYEKTSAMKKIGARYPTIPLPGCAHLHFRSDEYWRCYIRQTGASGLHGAGTCRLGSGPEDPRAVVDPTLKVIGFRNLRVVDVSIMPEVVNPNTHAGAYVIAEKASDMILREAEGQLDDRRCASCHNYRG